jgi:hypothetical protein
MTMQDAICRHVANNVKAAQRIGDKNGILMARQANKGASS